MSSKGYYQRVKNDPSTRIYRIWNNARQRAKRSSIPFTISLEWFAARVEAGWCEVTGIPLNMGVRGDTSRSNPWCPSLDQINPGQGYTEGNTQVVCWIYNSAKNQWGHADVLQLSKALSG